MNTVEVLTLFFLGVGAFAALLGIWLYVQKQKDRRRKLRRENSEDQYQSWLMLKETALREKKNRYNNAQSTGGQPAANAVGSPTLTATIEEIPLVERAIREKRLSWWDDSKGIFVLYKPIAKIPDSF